MAQSMTLAVTNAIRDGTFPDSNDILSSELSSSTIPELLKAISSTKEDLDQDIRSVSRSLVSGVDEWISQAKKVQQDIQQCKVEARNIVKEHSLAISRQAEAAEAGRKFELLEQEILFTQSLQSELRNVASTTQQLRNVEELLVNGKVTEAAIALSSTKPKTAAIRPPGVRSIVLDFQADLQKRTQSRLEADLASHLTHNRGDTESALRISLVGSNPSVPLNTIKALQAVAALEEAAKPLTANIDAFALDALRFNASKQISSHFVENDLFLVRYDSVTLMISEAIGFAQDFVHYLHARLPKELLEPIAEPVISKVVSALITDWLNAGISTNLSSLDDFDHVRAAASSLAQAIDSYGWQGATQLAQWLEQSPRIWLTKRKADTLNAVRRIFVLSKGNTHQVERVERQKASTFDKPTPNKEQSNDWDASWDDDQQDQTPSVNRDADDTSGWGFDDDEEDLEAKTPHRKKNGADVDEGDAGDAWGWDEDNEDKSNAETSSKVTPANGAHSSATDSQELVLRENYTVTDIPDHLIEVISKDIQDALFLQDEPHPSLADIPASSGLLALPTLALAMFRATASTHYANTLNLGNMHLYNDASYIASKLLDMNAPSAMTTIPSDAAAMHKFARSAYAREMEVQRTILNDLLDGAQGFSNCTQFPYSQEIESAVTSTVDRLRTVNAEWKPVLSTSALLQSLGSLLASAISKFINDVEELEDIGEAQSHVLAAFCQQFTALEDLFLATPPAGPAAATTEEPLAMTAVYVPNWLKLQYLAQILESSLVDIKYLWTEGELSLEFEGDELADLVRALFAESARRKEVIAAVKRGR